MPLTSWGWGVVETKAYTELGTEGRSTCVIRMFSICLGKNQIMVNTNLRYMFPQRVLFSFFPFTASLSLPPLFCVYFCCCPSSLPLSLIPGFSSFRSVLSSPFPHSSNGYILTEKTSSFAYDRELKVVTVLRIQKSSISHYSGATVSQACIHSAALVTAHYQMMVGLWKVWVMDRGRGLGGEEEEQTSGWWYSFTSQRLRESLENINILMFQCGSSSIILDDMVHFRFGWTHSPHVFQKISGLDLRSRKKNNLEG